MGTAGAVHCRTPWEATDTAWFGFKDDVLLRLTSDDTLVDICL